MAKRWLSWGTYIALVAAGMTFLHLRLIDHALDDAYIHFRIAHHLAVFGQPYFNLNEPVMGTSSTGWTLLLALLFRIFGESIHMVAILNAVFVTGGMALFSFTYTRRIVRFRMAVMAIFSLTYAEMILLASAGLMESSFCMFVLGGALLLLSYNNALGVTLLAASVFIRYEMVVVFALVGVVYLALRKISLKRFIPSALLGSAPFVIWQMVYFGTLIPQTVLAKSKIYDIPLGDVLNGLMSSLRPFGLPLDDLQWKVCLGGLAILLVASIPGRLRSGAGGDLLDLPVLTMCSVILVLGVYLLWRVSFFEWYQPMFTIPILLGALYWLVSWPDRMYMNCSGLTLGAVIAFGGILLSVLIATTPDFGRDATHARVKAYIQVGRELSRRYPGKTLLAAEIGGLGWGFDGKIIDAVGLVSPEALRYHPMAVPEERANGYIGAIPPGLVRELQPDIIVSYDIFSEAFRKSPEIHDYVETKRPALQPADMVRFPDGVWGSRTLTVFIRRRVVDEEVAP